MSFFYIDIKIINYNIITKMPRVLLTPEQREESKRIANERNKQWQINHKDRFDTYMKSYYQENKERLNARKKALRKFQKDQIIAENIGV